MNAVKLTAEEVRSAIADTVADIIEDYKDDPDTDRETLIERMDEECDAMWGRLVQHGMISEYDAQDLARTATACGVIIEVAEEDAWGEDDRGLWEGLTYGVLASQAYFSLRNCLYKAMKDAGHDSNDDLPFAKDEADDA